MKHIINKRKIKNIAGHYTFNSAGSSTSAVIKGNSDKVKVTITSIDSLPLITKIHDKKINFSLVIK